ncbi:MAG: hypothetical protein VX278_04420 [Myxococcota bacterium]|nr:hypothetical protein [Myxococcota bacterium]
MLIFILMACQGENATQKTEPVTYYKDVLPVLSQNCLRCHMGNGPGIGDFSDPIVAQQFGNLMLTSIDDGRMPPPVSDPDCHDYIDSEKMFISAASRDIIAQWVESGKELGEEEDAPEIDLEAHQLEDPDLTLLISSPYIPTYEQSNSEGNEYRCFVLEHGQTDPFYITELHPIIDQEAIVHHIVLAKSPRDALQEDAFQPEGVDCISGAQALVEGNSSGSGMLSAWAPGGSPLRFDGGGILMQPDEVFILQMHYYIGKADPGIADRSGYSMKIASEVEHTILMGPYGYHGFRIPAGDPAYTYGEEIVAPTDFRLWATFPHMHLLGTGYHMSIRGDGDDRCVVQSDNYDFNNQLTYQFEDPIRISQGERIYWECTWNNSNSNPNLYYDPPQDVYYGEKTGDEMCYAFSLISLGH